MNVGVSGHLSEVHADLPAGVCFGMHISTSSRKVDGDAAYGNGSCYVDTGETLQKFASSELSQTARRISTDAQARLVTPRSD